MVTRRTRVFRLLLITRNIREQDGRWLMANPTLSHSNVRVIWVVRSFWMEERLSGMRF